MSYNSGGRQNRSQGGYQRGNRFDGGYQGGRGGYQGGRDGGRGHGRGRGGNGSSGPTSISSAISNIILADITPNFHFYQYGIEATDKNGKLIDSVGRRTKLFHFGMWQTRYKDMPPKDLESLKRVVFFKGSFFYSGRLLEGLQQSQLPVTLVDGTSTEGDVMRVVNVRCFTAPTEISTGRASMDTTNKGEVKLDRRCANCTRAFCDYDSLIAHCEEKGHLPVFEEADNDEIPRAPSPSVFLGYCNVALTQAMMERMARWGRDFVDPKSFTEPKDRNGNDMGIRVYESYVCSFGMLRPGSGGRAHLALTVDIKAKLIRSRSMLDTICGNVSPTKAGFTQAQQAQLKRKWIGESIIATYDKKIYHVKDLLFDQSPSSLPIEGLGMSHADYFQKRKGLVLRYPNVKLMIAVEGRRDSTIYIPPELVCGTDIDQSVKRQLPMLTSYKPKVRNDAINEVKRYLVPGAQKTKGKGGGLLPALGIILKEVRLAVNVKTAPLPQIMAAGVKIPEFKAQNWAPTLIDAKYNVEPKQVTKLNVVLFCHQSVQQDASSLYGHLGKFVNKFQASFTFPQKPFAIVPAGDNERHWGEVERYFSGPRSQLPDNIFVVDFNRPRNRATSDPAYGVVKQMLGKAGYLSQFINLNTCNHAQPRDMREKSRSDMILQNVARQILSKCGFRVWWVSIPPSLPLPAIFVGIDVFHAPRVYDPKSKTRAAKASCAAIIVQVIRQSSAKSRTVEIYSETFKRSPSNEYELGNCMKTTITNALKTLKVNPASCIIWRDGVGDSAVAPTAAQEIPAIRKALAEAAPGANPSLAYIVCQKRITTKFITKDGEHSAPPGTIIMGVQGLEHSTFYINGTSPNFATAKPVRFIVAESQNLNLEMLSELTWALCHDYPNWAGPVKVPGPVQMAHKAAELAGNFVDCGDSLNNKEYANRMYFL